MPRESRVLGKYELPPSMPMSKAMKDALTVVGHFRDQAFSNEALASALGYSSAKSGPFHQRIADLRKYGVLTGRGSQLTACPLAQAIYNDRPGERAKALREMMESIPLFKALYEKFGDKLPDDQTLTTALIQITDAGRPDVEGCLVMLREAYTDALSTVPAMPGGMKPVGATPSLGGGLGEGSFRGMEADGGRFTSSTPDGQYSVVADIDAIDSMIDHLQSDKKALERKLKSGHKPSDSEGAGRNVTPPSGGSSPAEK